MTHPVCVIKASISNRSGTKNSKLLFDRKILKTLCNVEEWLKKGVYQSISPLIYKSEGQQRSLSQQQAKDVSNISTKLKDIFCCFKLHQTPSYYYFFYHFNVIFKLTLKVLVKSVPVFLPKLKKNIFTNQQCL